MRGFSVCTRPGASAAMESSALSMFAKPAFFHGPLPVPGKFTQTLPRLVGWCEHLVFSTCNGKPFRVTNSATVWIPQGTGTSQCLEHLLFFPLSFFALILMITRRLFHLCPHICIPGKQGERWENALRMPQLMSHCPESCHFPILSSALSQVHCHISTASILLRMVSSGRDRE